MGRKEPLRMRKSDKLRKELNHLEIRFADNFIRSGNKADSAKDAGYRCADDSSFAKVGQELYKRRHIRLYIEQYILEMNRDRLAAEDAMGMLSGIALGQYTETVPIATPRGVEMVEKDVDLGQRTQALKEILRRHGTVDQRIHNNKRIELMEAQIDKIRHEIANGVDSETQLKGLLGVLGVEIDKTAEGDEVKGAKAEGSKVEDSKADQAPTEGEA